MKTFQKIFSVLAVLAMIVSLVPMNALAEEPVTAVISVSITTQGTPPETPETYTVRMSAEGDFPMPEGADGKDYDLKVEGATSASFPAISYDKVGIYTYTVKQIPGTTEGVEYDASVYDVKVTVFNKEGGGLDIAVAIRKQGSEEKTTIQFVNIYPVEKTSKTIKKVWDDADDQDGIRPTEITAVLTDGTNTWTVTLNPENGWTATVEDLDMYVTDTRDPITYTWEEIKLDGTPYELTGSETDGDITTITNSYEPETTEVTVEKFWDDSDNKDGIRPSGDEQLTVTLLANGEEILDVVLNEANGWTATVTGLPKKAAGEDIEYTWIEKTPPPGYELTGTTTDGNTTTLYNTHEVEDEISVTILKKWDDGDDQDGIRPEEITVILLADGEELMEVQLTADDGWKTTVTGLPKTGEDGEEIVYTWKEPEIPGYTVESIDTDGTITTITNKHVPETKEITIRKVWDDNDNQDGLRRPVTLVLTGTVDGVVVVTYTWEVKDDETLEKTFTVPVYYNGKIIVYTVNEPDVPEGYSKTVDNETLTVTNKHDPDTIDIEIIKIWEDDGDRDGKRPENITVKLIKNGDESEVIIVTGTGDVWSIKVTGLPKYTDGVENVYTIVEIEIDGYTVEIKDYVIINTHEPETTTQIIKKVWDDEDNENGNRPASILVTLTADGQAIMTVTLDENNQWTAIVPDLFVYEDGKPIVYAWTEDEIEHYELIGTVTEVTEDGTVTILTNKEIPPYEPDKDLGLSMSINIGDCIE